MRKMEEWMMAGACAHFLQEGLRVMVKEVKAGRIKSGDPNTFIPYSEAYPSCEPPLFDLGKV
jgi:hypothetical protein